MTLIPIMTIMRTIITLTITQIALMKNHMNLIQTLVITMILIETRMTPMKTSISLIKIPFHFSDISIVHIRDFFYPPSPYNSL